MIKFLKDYIDVAALANLEESGVLKKHGRGAWYQVLDQKKLPHHIACIPKEMKKEVKNGKEKLYLKFPTPAQIKKAKSMLDEMGSK